jgi:hypothetical protein
MWQLLLGILVPMAIRLGAEAVLAAFPNMPQWVKDILNKLKTEKAMAAEIQCPAERKAEVKAAKHRAITALKRAPTKQ